MVALSSKSNTGFISGSFPLQMCHFPSYSVTEHFWKLLPCYETLNSGRCSSLLGQMQTAHSGTPVDDRSADLSYAHFPSA